MRAWLLRLMLRLFRTLSRSSLWFETRFTATGRLVIGGAIVAAIFGVDPRQTLAFQLAAVLLSVLLVAMLLSLRWRPRLELARLLPDTVTVDTATSYSVSITNHGDTAEHDLVLADRLLTRYPTEEAFRHKTIDSTEDGLNWFDRKVGFPRLLDLLRVGRGARLQPQRVPSIPPHSTITVTIPLTSLRRGKLIFTELEVKRPDPIGIFFAKYRVKLHGDVVSLPKRYALPPLDWISERHFHRGGVALAATVGDSEEFIGLREYRPGDPLRHIHWRSFAKRGIPVVKEHQDEFFDRHALVIDTFTGTSAPQNFEAAIALAASFILSDRPSDSILDLIFIERRVWHRPSGRGLSNNRDILIQLAELQPASADEFDRLTAYLEPYLDRLASIIMVTTSWNPARRKFVEELARRRLRCLALCVGESNASGENAPVAAAQMTDIEPHYVRPSMLARDIANITPLGATGN